MSQVRNDVECLRAKRLPILSAVTQNDRIVEWQLPLELARHCGATDSQITFLDEHEKVVHGPSTGQCMDIPLTLCCLQMLGSVLLLPSNINKKN